MAHAAAAHAAAVANATKASGVIVNLDPGDFQAIVRRADHPLIVAAQGGVIRKHYEYLTSYKGLAFFTKSGVPLVFAGKYEMIMAKKIWIPG
ncbi:MAG TPA: hypothetical protein VJ812_00465 [Gemmatimonadaceae bacterium]|jgi:hypothetical protein|nr:hypothetical protein [Gemmatimonadaceae bacterium]